MAVQPDLFPAGGHGHTGRGQPAGERDDVHFPRPAQANAMRVHNMVRCIRRPTRSGRPTMDQLRWGILGVAKINNRLLPGFRGARNADLVAIASRSPEKAAAAAKAANIPVSHGSYEALLADRNVDAVYIPLPNTLHAEWTRKAADAGKHVLCEKPLAPTAAEADAVVKYCRSKTVKLMDGFMWPHHARTARLRHLLDSGTIGEVRQVCGSFTFMLGDDPSNIR